MIYLEDIWIIHLFHIDHVISSPEPYTPTFTNNNNNNNNHFEADVGYQPAVYKQQQQHSYPRQPQSYAKQPQPKYRQHQQQQQYATAEPSYPTQQSPFSSPKLHSPGMFLQSTFFSRFFLHYFFHWIICLNVCWCTEDDGEGGGGRGGHRVIASQGVFEICSSSLCLKRCKQIFLYFYLEKGAKNNKMVGAPTAGPKHRPTPRKGL